MQRRKVQSFSNIRNLLLMKNKKKRSENFNRSEVYLLVDIIEKYKTVVENKKLNAAAWADKKAAWENIACEFNKISGNPSRTWKTLKLKYEGIKKEIKRKYCLIKEHPSKATANDRLHTEFLSCYEQKVLSMMQPGITGFQTDHQESDPPSYDDIKIEDMDDEQEEHSISSVGNEANTFPFTGDEAVTEPLQSNDETLRIRKAETFEEDEASITNFILQDDFNVSVPISSTGVNYANSPQVTNRYSAFKKQINMDKSIMEDVPSQKLMELKRKVLVLQGTLLRYEIEDKMKSRQLEQKILETNLETARIELKIKQKILEQMRSRTLNAKSCSSR